MLQKIRLWYGRIIVFVLELVLQNLCLNYGMILNFDRSQQLFSFIFINLYAPCRNYNNCPGDRTCHALPWIHYSPHPLGTVSCHTIHCSAAPPTRCHWLYQHHLWEDFNQLPSVFISLHNTAVLFCVMK